MENTKPKFGIGTILKHSQFGKGKVLGYSGNQYEILFVGNNFKRISFDSTDMNVITNFGDPEFDRIQQAVREVLGDYGFLDSDIEISSKWAGGSVRLIPGKEGTQEKEIPLEVFFKKIISIREKLRVLEQKLNNHPKLTEEEKIDFQSYITRSYGSLTSFNVLFQNKESQFTGVKSEGKD